MNRKAILQVLVPASVCAVVIGVSPVGLALAVTFVLCIGGGIARATVRYSDAGRWITTGIYFGSFLGFILSIMQAVRH